jgi:hypothetical protein
MLGSISTAVSSLKYLDGGSFYLLLIPVAIAIIINILVGFISIYVAREKGYNGSIWFWVSLLLGIAGIIAAAGLPDRKYVHTGLQEIFKKITRLTREGIISEDNYKRLIKIKREVNFFGEVSLETTKVLDELLQENHLTKEEVDTLANLIPDSERVNK